MRGKLLESVLEVGVIEPTVGAVDLYPFYCDTTPIAVRALVLGEKEREDIDRRASSERLERR